MSDLMEDSDATVEYDTSDDGSYPSDVNDADDCELSGDEVIYEKKGSFDVLQVEDLYSTMSKTVGEVVDLVRVCILLLIVLSLLLIIF